MRFFVIIICLVITVAGVTLVHMFMNENNNFPKNTTRTTMTTQLVTTPVEVYHEDTGSVTIVTSTTTISNKGSENEEDPIVPEQSTEQSTTSTTRPTQTTSSTIASTTATVSPVVTTKVTTATVGINPHFSFGTLYIDPSTTRGHNAEDYIG